MQPFDDSVMGALTSLRATGSDPDRNAEVTLDGRGRLVDLVVTDLLVGEGRRAVERGIRAAFDAAADDLDRQREEQAAQLLEQGQLRIGALTEQLQALSDHADARMRDALQQLKDQTDRVGGGR